MNKHIITIIIGLLWITVAHFVNELFESPYTQGNFWETMQALLWTIIQGSVLFGAITLVKSQRIWMKGLKGMVKG